MEIERSPCRLTLKRRAKFRVCRWIAIQRILKASIYRYEMLARLAVCIAGKPAST
jgi:hypothetical protein